MNMLQTKIKNEVGSSNSRLLQNLFNAYDKIGYSPEFYDDSTIIIRTPVEFIVTFVDENTSLSLGRLYRLWTPLKEISEFTGIKNYIIISKYGFDKECYQVEGYSIRLETLDYVNNIIKSNSLIKPLELLPHNHIAFKNLMTMWKKERLASIIQATGTGKSYIIAKAIQNHKGMTLLICPTLYIISQFKELFISANINLNKIEFITYAKLSRLSDNEIKNIKCNLIIVDELHRAGAEKWGEGVTKIINFNKNAKVLGATATPIRYLDDKRNMAEELFNGNIASSLDLFDAMARGILPVPKYIEALYDITSDLDSLENDISSSNVANEKKEELLDNIKKFKISWDGVRSISNIIKKHYTKDIKKVIVFCKDVNHIKEVTPLVHDWFTTSNVYEKVNLFMSYTTNGEEKDELDQFKKTIKRGEVNLLFSVDKLNEGVHVEDVNSVIFLRKTQSPNVLVQQIGRTLSATNGVTPIVLDLIDNIELLDSHSFYDNINISIDRFNRKKKELNFITDAIEPIDVNFTVVDETKDFIKFIEKTMSYLNHSWDELLNMSIDCKNRTGWFPGPNTPEEDKFLIKWVTRQRKLYANNLLSADKLEKLTAANFPFSFTKEKWFKMYNELLKYISDNNLTTLFRHIISDTQLAIWVQKQRRRKSLGQMDEEEFSLLKDLGISFNNNEDLWNYYIDRIKSFYNTIGHKNPTESEDYELCIFCRAQRRRYAEGTLPQDKIDLLNSINFIWTSSDTSIKFGERLVQLEQYIRLHGDSRVPSRYAEVKGLGEWVKLMRTKKRKGLLSEEKINALNKLNFCWNPLDENVDDTIQEIINYTIAKRDTKNKVTASKSLSDYMTKIRNKYSNNELSSDIIARLDEVGFNWNPVKDTWSKRLSQLKEYYSLYNTFKISIKKDFPDADGLQAWLNRQRAIYKKGNYPQEKMLELNSIGFYFDKKYPKL